MKNPYPPGPVDQDWGHEPTLYVFTLTVMVKNRPVALIRIKANTYMDAKEVAARAITVGPAEDLLPTIDLEA